MAKLIKLKIAPATLYEATYVYLLIYFYFEG